MAVYKGRCHCGALSFAFETGRPLAPRACQCSFCRKHAAWSISDPDGNALISLGGEAIFYRFASRAADYILCGRCGAYLGAVADMGGATYATLNLNLVDPAPAAPEAVPVSYEGEDAEVKVRRRRERWTPAQIARL